MTIESFSAYLYRGTIIELSGVGLSGEDNPIVYVGNIEDMPEEYLNCRIAYVAVSGEAEYTMRIESSDLPMKMAKDDV